MRVQPSDIEDVDGVIESSGLRGQWAGMVRDALLCLVLTSVVGAFVEYLFPGLPRWAVWVVAAPVWLATGAYLSTKWFPSLRGPLGLEDGDYDEQAGVGLGGGVDDAPGTGGDGGAR